LNDTLSDGIPVASASRFEFLIGILSPPKAILRNLSNSSFIPHSSTDPFTIITGVQIQFFFNFIADGACRISCSPIALSGKLSETSHIFLSRRWRSTPFLAGKPRAG